MRSRTQITKLAIRNDSNSVFDGVRQQWGAEGEGRGEAHEVHDAGAGEPNGHEHCGQLTQTDRVGRPQDVQELQDVRHRHERQCAYEPQTCAHNYIHNTLFG